MHFFSPAIITTPSVHTAVSLYSFFFSLLFNKCFLHCTLSLYFRGILNQKGTLLSRINEPKLPWGFGLASRAKRSFVSLKGAYCAHAKNEFRHFSLGNDLSERRLARVNGTCLSNFINSSYLPFIALCHFDNAG